MDCAVVIDTNVGIVSNGKHDKASVDCIAACIRALDGARAGVVVIDDAMRIMDEYRRHLSPKGQPGAGDAFFKWLWDNQGNTARCRQVTITPIGGSSSDFAEYPMDPALATFDPSDRKFIAVARASGLDPDILQATDSKWWQLRDDFQRCGLKVEFLCPELMNGTGERR